MKTIGIIICFLSTGIVFAQQAYNWVNRPYNPERISETDLINYYDMQGAVKTVEDQVITQNAISGTRTEYRVQCQYSSSGQLTSWEKLGPHNVLIRNSIVYDAQENFKMLIIAYDDGLKARMDFRYDTLWTDPYQVKCVPDSATYDARKNMVYALFGSAEVYSFYDENNRKTRDSVPYSLEIPAHQITYDYKRKKVLKRTTFPAEDLNLVETYWLDQRGNWVKCEIKSNDNVPTAVIQRTIHYYSAGNK